MKHLKNIELDFLKDDQERIIVSIGCKGSSKTYTALSYLKFCFYTNRYEKYHLIMPSYANDNNQGQYDFLRRNPKVTIYSKYSPLVIKGVMNKNLNEKHFLFIDDSTQYGADLATDKTFLQLLTTSRHLKIKLWAVFHACKRVMSPQLRMNIDYLLLHRITNDMLLESIYQEYFSMMPDFTSYKQFKLYYYNNVFNVKYNFMLFSCIDGLYWDQGKDMVINTIEWGDQNFLGKAKEINVDLDKDKAKIDIERMNMKNKLKKQITEKLQKDKKIF